MLDCNVSVLIGKTLASVVRGVGNDDDEIVFVTIDGETYKLYHFQDCCEHVAIEDIAGDLQDLVGSPILMAEEASNSEETPPPDDSSEVESYTWTFYKFATIKGYVTIRWFGSSNGYYSESVDFARTDV